MKTPLFSLALVASALALGTLSLSAGESRRPSAEAKAINGVPQQSVPRGYERPCVWVPFQCRVTPIQVFRYGNPVAPVSACFYGYPSIREFRFYQNYPVSRNR